MLLFPPRPRGSEGEEGGKKECHSWGFKVVLRLGSGVVSAFFAGWDSV